MDDLETNCMERLNFAIPVYYRYVDDIFMILPANRLTDVLNTFNNYHPRLKFTVEIENNNTLNFLNTSVFREDRKLFTNWYRKPTFSGRYINYFSSHQTRYKINTIINLVDQAVLLSDSRFHDANINIIKDILLNNSYPPSFIDKHINRRLHHLKHHTGSDTTVPTDINRDFTNSITIPYVGNVSDVIKKILHNQHIDTRFSASKKLDLLIRKGKDRIADPNRTELVYQLNCVDCDAIYISQTKRHVVTRINEHRNDIKKPVDNHSVVSKHRNLAGHEFDWSNPLILHKEPHFKKREIAEMFYIKKSHDYTINLQQDTDNLSAIYDKIVRTT
ncbi:PREDICTED: uncharacterized protein LOC105555883 [Vollenhovia emeryi]|uniref:uncharacterized protein LOC105555883 n=1 Tax=Vollenhovia emeryi TaxID=411798 RepID=UPI0005F50BD2|nr:PREDICTED: uncharacterized protein LOC105555883 [Vollenhovia emeryi]